MQCEYCGSPLSLEDEVCPHCGQPNKHAQKHLADMRRYQGEFESTKRRVYEKTDLHNQVLVRLIFLAVLVLLSTGLFWLADNVFSIQRSLSQRKADRAYEANAQLLDGYLEEGNFQAFDAFCQANYITSYEGAYAAKYGRAIRASSAYVQLMNQLEEDVFLWDASEAVRQKWLGDAFDYFYQSLAYEPYAFTQETEDPLVAQALGQMEVNVEQFLVSYCAFTPEEAAGMKDLSLAGRAVLLEQRLGGQQDER